MSASSRKILNRGAMQALIGDDQALAKQFEYDFLKQAKTSIEQIVTAYNTNQITELKEAAHFLKTSAKAIGAEQTADFLQDLEDTSLSKGKESCKPIIEQLVNSIKQVHGEIINDQ